MKITMIIIFIILGLFSLLVGEVGPGISASGSGCGESCQSSVIAMRVVSIIFFALAIITAIRHFKNRKSSDDQNKKNLP